MNEERYIKLETAAKILADHYLGSRETSQNCSRKSNHVYDLSPSEFRLEMSMSFGDIKTVETARWIKEPNFTKEEIEERRKELDDPEIDEEFRKCLERILKNNAESYSLVCSACGCYGDGDNIETPYCAFCGAKMKISELDI